MKERLYDFIDCILLHKDLFLSPNPNEWTDEQKVWGNDWSNYITKGGVRPPGTPPHP